MTSSSWVVANEAGIDSIVDVMKSRQATPEETLSTVDAAQSYYVQTCVPQLTSKSGTAGPAEPAPEDAAEQVCDSPGTYPLSFSAITEMIATGKTDEIPNMREIPLQINSEPPSESKMERPRKPWET